MRIQDKYLSYDYEIIPIRSHFSPFHPKSHLHFAPEHVSLVQFASHTPCPLQCSLVAPVPVEHRHKLHSESQAFQFRKSSHDPSLFTFCSHVRLLSGSTSLALVHEPVFSIVHFSDKLHTSIGIHENIIS